MARSRSPEPADPRSALPTPTPAPRARRSALRARVRRWVAGPLRDAARRDISLRQLLRWLLVALVVVVPCAAWGVATASARGTLGPHTARYEVTLDSEVTVDFGPLGTLVIDSPVPVVGVHVVVKEIPSDMTSVEASVSVESLASDLNDYVRFFNAPQQSVEAALHGLVDDAIHRAVGAVLVVVVALVLLRAALGAARRRELSNAFRPYHLVAASAVSAVLLVTATVTASTPLVGDRSQERMASSVFDGTPLEGARITGRLAGVIDTYGGMAVDAYRTNTAFYARATTAVRDAWAERTDVDERVAAASAAARLPRPGEADEQSDADAAPEPVVMLVVSDIHCNVGMAGPIGAVAELSGATVVLNAGDTTVNGSAVEGYCVTALVDALPDGTQMVAVMGNHDGQDTATQARDAGVRLLEGEVTDVDGIKILGAADPRATRIGLGTTLTGNTTLADLSDQLTEVACEHPGDVDILLIHDPAVGEAALKSGCVPTQISGHLHKREGPTWMSPGTQYVSSSTAGAALDQPTIGPLTHTAEMTVLRLDRATGRVLDYRLVQVRPDGTATVGTALAWPEGPPQTEPTTPYR